MFNEFFCSYTDLRTIHASLRKWKASSSSSLKTEAKHVGKQAKTHNGEHLSGTKSSLTRTKSSEHNNQTKRTTQTINTKNRNQHQNHQQEQNHHTKNNNKTKTKATKTKPKPNTKNTTKNTNDTKSGLTNIFYDNNTIYREMTRMSILSFCEIVFTDKCNNKFNERYFDLVHALNGILHSTVPPARRTISRLAPTAEGQNKPEVNSSIKWKEMLCITKLVQAICRKHYVLR